MTDSRNTSDLTNKLVRIAYRLIEKGQHSDGEEILDATHAIRGRSLFGSIPDNNIMQSLSSLLTDLECNFAIIGAIALAVHGQVRNTEDIDALVDPFPPRSKTKDTEYMRTFGFYPAGSSTGTMITIDHRKNGQIELLSTNTPLRQWALSTASKTMILGNLVPVVSAPALIAMKVVAMAENPKRRSKDQPDIVSILIRSKPDLNEAMNFLSDSEKAILQKIVDSVSNEPE